MTFTGRQNSMKVELSRLWRRGAIALAIPGACLLAVALRQINTIASRTIGDSRAVGAVIDLNLTHNRGSRPTIEYAVEGNTYQVRTRALYPAAKFTLGQNVMVHYPPARPDLGILDSFRECWPLTIFLSIASIALISLAWKARTGLSPMFHTISAVAIFLMGSLVGMMFFSLLCVPGGFAIFAGAPWMVALIGGAVIFFCSVPTAALGSLTLWQACVPARCPHCNGGTWMHFVGKQIRYRCSWCYAEQ